MAELYLATPYVVLGGSDVSAYVRGVTLNIGRENLDNTVAGATRTSAMGLKIWSASITFRQDFADNLVDEILWGLHDAGAAFAVIIAPVTGGEGAGNPEYTGNMVFDGPYSPISGSIGDYQEVTVGLTAAGAITRDVTP